ncbi:hypothetical protein [Thiocapsa rosea]|uniref:hypothetical protein n=1 Tax=Thiocapsa rosea TaxID=69360 RepID=UPI000EB24770|nr:hypothetical protein [Thiocapsa rosea]
MNSFSRYARLFESWVEPNLGLLDEAGHPEPRIVAMDCASTAAAVLDHGLRWGIEPVFSVLRRRSFGM